MKHPAAWLAGLLIWAVLCARLHAQDTVPRTYIFTVVNYGTIEAGTLEAIVINRGGTVRVTVDFPEARTSFVIASMSPAGMGNVVALFNGGVVAEENQPLEPDGSPGSGPYGPSIPTNYAVDKVAGPNLPAPPCRSPVRFVGIDSGIRYPLGDFPASRVVFDPPYMPPTVLSPSGGPAVPFLPGTWMGLPSADADELDHGTGVLSCAVGTQAGILGRVPSIPAVVQSFRIHQLGACAALTSDAVQALARAAQDEALRELDGSLGNDAAVILFPYRTVCGVSYAIDHQIWKAARAGALVVCGSGNSNFPNQPGVVASYPPADPNEDEVCTYTSPPVVPGSPARFGPLVPRSPACPPGPCPPYFLFVGGSNATDTRWMSDPLNGSNFSSETDVFAPAGQVPVASSTALNAFHVVSGTSYSTGYAAGMAAYYLTQRPWAAPEEVRIWLMTQTTAPPPVSLSVSPSGTRYRLSLSNRTAVECCLDYTGWTAQHRMVGAAALAAADFDKDGLSNVLEYGIGSNPRASTPAAGLWIHNIAGTSYLRAAKAFWLTSGCGVTWRIERSADLLLWTDVTSQFAPVLPETRDNDGTVYQSTAPLVAPASRLFYRVYVSIP